jgi:hypothetical protein
MQPTPPIGALTITEAALEQQISAKLKPEQMSAVKRIYIGGMKFLFSPQTHKQVFDEFMKGVQQNAQHDIGSVLGADMAHVMLILYGESKGTMPPIAIIPAATLLIAKTCEFLNTTKTMPITDKDFGTAVHMMSTVIQSKLNPKFNQSIGAQSNAQPATPTAPPAAQPSGMMAQPQGGM